MLVYKLLQDIQKYYPIGLPYHNEVFDGYHLVESIVRQKIQLLTKRQPIGPWRSFIQDVKKSYPRLKRQNLAFAQVPSLSLLITSKELIEPTLQQHSYVIGVVSLLLPYYTVYIQEVLSGLTTSQEVPIRFVRCFERPALTELERSLIDKLKHCLSVHYPTFTDVDYEIAKKRLIGGIPYGADPASRNIEYPLFDFLYGHQIGYPS